MSARNAFSSVKIKQISMRPLTQDDVDAAHTLSVAVGGRTAPPIGDSTYGRRRALRARRGRPARGHGHMVAHGQEGRRHRHGDRRAARAGTRAGAAVDACGVRGGAEADPHAKRHDRRRIALCLGGVPAGRHHSAISGYRQAGRDAACPAVFPCAQRRNPTAPRLRRSTARRLAMIGRASCKLSRAARRVLSMSATGVSSAFPTAAASGAER